MQRHFLDAKEKVHATMTVAAQEYYEKIEAELKTDHGKEAKIKADDFQ